jgi:hypothetical protein
VVEISGKIICKTHNTIPIPLEIEIIAILPLKILIIIAKEEKRKVVIIEATEKKLIICATESLLPPIVAYAIIKIIVEIKIQNIDVTMAQKNLENIILVLLSGLEKIINSFPSSIGSRKIITITVAQKIA